MNDHVHASRWRILFGGHVANLGAVSPSFATIFGLFLKPMAEDTGWSRGDVALALTFALLASSAAAPFAGWLLDRLGARRVTFLSVGLLPLSIVLFAMALPSRAGFYAAAMFVGIVGTLSFPMIYSSLLPRFFDRRLGFAIAIVISGLSTGAILNALIAGHVIEVVGWRQGWFVIAAWSLTTAFIGRSLVNFKALRDPVRLMSAGAVGLDGGAESRNFLREPAFWVYTVAFLFAITVTLAVQTNVASMLTDRGLSARFAASVVAAMGAGALAARLLGGVLLDKFSFALVGAVTFAGQGLGCVLLASTASPAMAMLGAVSVSIALGVESDMLPYLIRRRYGMAQFGRIYGVMFGTLSVGSAFLGPPAVAMAYDRFGNYTVAFFVLAGFAMVAAIIIARTGKLATPSALAIAQA